MNLIDTNILINYILQNHISLIEDEKYLLYQFDNLPLESRVIPDFIITEFSNVMVKVIPSRLSLSPGETKNLLQKVSKFINKILLPHTFIITPSIKELHQASSLFQKQLAAQKSKKRLLDLTDLSLISISKTRKMPILTGDQSLLKFT